MLFIILLVAAMAAIIAFCMFMEKHDNSKNRYTYIITDNSSSHNLDHEWNPLDPADPYNDCPDCGSGDTDGNHCYDCDGDF